MSMIRLRSADGFSTAAVSTHGARVLDWTNAGSPRLFVPAALARDERAAPHGGIPVLHPQFGFFGPGRKHGWVHDREWKVESHGAGAAILRLQLDGASIGMSYALKLCVSLSDTALRVDLAITNTGSDVAEFTCGLHTYLRVDDIADVVLHGLEKTVYMDALDALILKPAEATPLQAPINVDRVYVQAPKYLQLRSGTSALTMTQAGFGDTVVWNPGAEIARTFTDLADEEWRQFLCVEAAQIKPPVQLAAGASWQGSQVLEVLDT